MDNIAKANKKVTQEAEVNKGFDELIKTFEHIDDKSIQTMPLLSSVMQHAVKIVKVYREAFNAARKIK